MRNVVIGRQKRPGGVFLYVGCCGYDADFGSEVYKEEECCVDSLCC